MGTLFRFNHPKGMKLNLMERREFTGSLDEISLILPEGAYVTFRTYEANKAFHLQDHINRLTETMRVAIIEIQELNSDIRQALHICIDSFYTYDIRVRLIIPFDNVLTLFVLLEKITVPEQKDYEQGVQVLSAQFERAEPEKKQTGFIDSSKELRSKVEGPIKEVLLVNHEGYILEGLSSNVFFGRENCMFTAGKGILEGVTRKIVLETCEQLEIKVNYQAMQMNALGSIDEAFITSTSRAVLPVVKINNKVIGNGKPGEMTRQIMKGFEAKIEEGLEKL